MSQRHRTEDSLVPLKKEVRAHAHSERHRIHVELQSVAQDVSSGLEPEDVHEPGSSVDRPARCSISPTRTPGLPGRLR